jgi:hypothetical protein
VRVAEHRPGAIEPELPVASVCYRGCQLRSAKCLSVTVRSNES